MSNFSVNQVHHLYVANNGYSAASNPSAGTITKVVKTPENELYFLFKGADGIVKSDNIPLGLIKSAQVIDATKNGTPMRKVEVTLNSTINSGAPVSGQDYVLGINFRNFFSSGDGSQYYKDAVVHATSGMSASDFYKAMVNSLNAAFSREPGATSTTNPYLTFSWKPNGTTATQADAIVIEEKAQDWALGTKKARRIMFDVFSSTIYTGGDDVIWGLVADAAPATTIGNGQKIADLEWFCMGERGDQYRNVGWPNVITTKYLTNADSQYDLIEIHYAFTDTGVNSYRTEKEITIAAPYDPTGGTTAAKHDKINDIIDAINTAYGTTWLTKFS